LRQTVNSNSDRITALEGELADAALPERTTPTDPDEARTTVIGDSESNVTIEAEKTATGESLVIKDTANGEAVSVGFTSDADGDNIVVGGNSYKLGESGAKILTVLSAKQNVAIAAYSNFTPMRFNLGNAYASKRIKLLSLMPVVETDARPVSFGYYSTIFEFTTDVNGVVSFNNAVCVYISAPSSATGTIPLAFLGSFEVLS